MQERGLEERDKGAPATKTAQMLGEDKSSGRRGEEERESFCEKVFSDDLKDTSHRTAGAVRSQIALPDTCMLSRHTRVT